jgi:hypothetical protein
MVKKQTQSVAGNVMKGIGLVAMAATAGAFFLYGSKDAAKNRKKVKGWALKAKGEVLDGIEKLKSIDEGTYNNLVDKVTEKYKKVKTIDLSDVDGLTRELKGHWKNLKKEISTPVKAKAKKAPSKKA